MLDATALNAETISGGKKVFQAPVIYTAKNIDSKVALFRFRGDDGKSLQASFSIPLALFKNTFVKLPANSVGGHGLYIKKPSPCYALKMKGHFYIQQVDSQNNKIANKGEPGDYLITLSSGANSVCPASEFKRKYVSSLDGLGQEMNASQRPSRSTTTTLGFGPK